MCEHTVCLKNKHYACNMQYKSAVVSRGSTAHYNAALTNKHHQQALAVSSDTFAASATVATVAFTAAIHKSRSAADSTYTLHNINSLHNHSYNIRAIITQIDSNEFTSRTVLKYQILITLYYTGIRRRKHGGCNLHHIIHIRKFALRHFAKI